MGWKLAECWIFSREKLKGFWGDWHFQGKVETFWSECWRSLHGSLFRQSAKCIFLLQNQNIFWYVLIFSRSFSDEVIAKCRTLNWEKGEMGKIYDLLFVRVVKMCSVSSFHTKDIKLDSINSTALECPVDKSDIKISNKKILLHPHIRVKRGGLADVVRTTNLFVV